jgi:hypothetical protein
MPGSQKLGASTDTTRKIDTLRRWSRQGVPHDKLEYLGEIADEMERVYLLMADARRRCIINEKYAKEPRIKQVSTLRPVLA